MLFFNRSGYRAHRKPGTETRCLRPSITVFSIFVLEFFVMHSLFNKTDDMHIRKDKTFAIPWHASQEFTNSLSPYTRMWILHKEATSPGQLRAARLSKSNRLMLRYFIADYTKFHIANRNNGTRRLVFRPTGAGLGDMFQVMTYTYWAAVLTDRVLLVNWTEPAPLADMMTAANPNINIFFDESVDKPNMKKDKDGRIRPDYIRLKAGKQDLARHREVLTSDVHTVYIETYRLPRDRSMDVSKSRKMPGMTASEVQNVWSNEIFQRAILHDFLRLNRHMKLTYKTLLSHFKLDNLKRDGTHRVTGYGKPKRRSFSGFVTDNPTYVAVHARIGKGVGESGGRFTEISHNLIAMARCLATRAVRISYQSGLEPVPIFLATDTEEFKDVFKDVVRNLSHGDVPVLSGNWKAVHMEQLRHSIRVNKTSITSEYAAQAMRGAYADLLMLGHAKHIISLYSSFPRLAAFLGNAESLTELRNHICLQSEK